MNQVTVQTWKDGKIIFDDDPIDLVLNKLSRWYNVEFELKDPELAEEIRKLMFVFEDLVFVDDVTHF